MKHWIFVVFTLASVVLLGQESYSTEVKEVVVATETGQIIVRNEVSKNGRKSSEHSLSIFGTLTISLKAATDVMQIGETLKKAYLEFVFSKECKVLEIKVIQTSQSKVVNEELKIFAEALLEKIQTENLNHLFLFDNEHGFVNQDSCTDNLNIAISMNLK